MFEKLKLLFIAIMGSVTVYFFTNIFIIKISFWEFFFIELLITLSHEIYNYHKTQVEPNSN
jgi:hypothetical protein